MVTGGTPPTVLDRLGAAVGAIERSLHPGVVLLFGSAACGKLTAESDVDIGVLLEGTRPDPFLVAELRTELEALLGCPVDLVLLDEASPILCMEVLKNHRVLVDRHPGLLERFTVHALGAYFDLKQVRRPIEVALRAIPPATPP